jgi:hypothetical protein
MPNRFDQIPIPKRMAHLDRDERGYLIPVMVFRDNAGRPHFTINNEATRFMLLMNEQCSICGQKLLRVRWFVGGPLSAFHEHGTYMDPPLHRECMRYALQVCPYLALPSYAKRIDARTVRDPEPNRIFIDPTQDPNRPVVFVCVGASGQSIRHTGPLSPIYVTPKRPYAAIEFWKDGRQISRVEAIRLIQQACYNG